MHIAVLDRLLYEWELENGFGPKKEGDAGIDLRSTQDYRIEPGRTEVIPLGVAVHLPNGTVGWMTGRSSLTSSYNALSHEGKIDQGYRGEVHHMVSALDRPVLVSRGDRIAQLVVLPIWAPTKWQIVSELNNDSDRGQRGFGSTGRD